MIDQILHPDQPLAGDDRCSQFPRARPRRKSQGTADAVGASRYNEMLELDHALEWHESLRSHRAALVFRETSR